MLNSDETPINTPNKWRRSVTIWPTLDEHLADYKAETWKSINGNVYETLGDAGATVLKHLQIKKQSAKHLWNIDETLLKSWKI